MHPLRDELLARLEPIPENLLGAPVDLLLAEHHRQDAICDVLQAIVVEPDGAAAPARAAAVIDYLARDLDRHVEDEEKSLAPHLRARCLSGDGLDDILRRLVRGHAEDRSLATSLLPPLRRLANGASVSGREALALSSEAFVRGLRGHLAWENRVFLPLARRRLRSADLDALGRSMAAERGVPYPA